MYVKVNNIQLYEGNREFDGVKPSGGSSWYEVRDGVNEIQVHPAVWGSNYQ